MNLFKRKSRVSTSIGIEVSTSGMSIAVCGKSAVVEEGHSPFLIKKLKILDDSASQGKQVLALREWVEREGLKGTKCSLTLKNGAYQLLLTEAPEVPEAEMRDAIRWKINDLTTIPLENAAIELFLLPGDGSRSGKKMAYVVVTELDKVKSLVDMVGEAGLELQDIDISELALRNLSLLKPEGQESGQGIAIVQIGQGRATVYLYRQGNLYLSRQFNLDYNGGLLDEIPEDNFLLEVQRSLDYYERQMGQVPPAMLYVCGENIADDKITINIRRGLSVPAQFLDLENLFSLNEGIESELIQECAGALGAAIRNEMAG